MINELLAKYRTGKKRSGAIRRTPLSEEVNQVMTWLMFTLLIMLVGSGVAFLYGMSTSAQDGYSLVQARLKHDILETENRELKLKVLEAQAFKNLEKSDTFDEMQKP